MTDISFHIVRKLYPSYYSFIFGREQILTLTYLGGFDMTF